MKKACFIFILFFAFLGYSEAQIVYGNYVNEEKFEDGIHVKYELIIARDFTFKFHFYQDQLCYVDNEIVNGNCVINGEEITLVPKEKSNTKNNNLLNLKDTKLKIVKNNSLQIYYSKTVWLKDLVLNKVD